MPWRGADARHPNKVLDAGVGLLNLSASVIVHPDGARETDPFADRNALPVAPALKNTADVDPDSYGTYPLIS